MYRVSRARRGRRFCREERKKTIDVDSAVAMLQLLHGETYPKHVPLLAEFLQAHEGACKRGVSCAVQTETTRPPCFLSARSPQPRPHPGSTSGR